MFGGDVRVKAFSLIELLVVISIVAVINIAMFPNFAAIQNTAKTIAAKSSARTIMVALEQYYFLYQVYPDGQGDAIYQVILELNNDDLIVSDPINPFTGDEYSLSDDSGQILYTRLSSDEYQLVGYGAENGDIIFEYP